MIEMGRDRSLRIQALESSPSLAIVLPQPWSGNPLSLGSIPRRYNLTLPPSRLICCGLSSVCVINSVWHEDRMEDGKMKEWIDRGKKCEEKQESEKKDREM